MLKPFSANGFKSGLGPNPDWNGLQKIFLLSYYASKSEQAENSLVLPIYCMLLIGVKGHAGMSPRQKESP